MIRQPPRSIRLHPRVPYTWLFRSILFVRSVSALVILAPLVWRAGPREVFVVAQPGRHLLRALLIVAEVSCFYLAVRHLPLADVMARSEEHTSELQSLMRISYAVFCFKQKKTTKKTQ